MEGNAGEEESYACVEKYGRVMRFAYDFGRVGTRI